MRWEVFLCHGLWWDTHPPKISRPINIQNNPFLFMSWLFQEVTEIWKTYVTTIPL
jgi:hypothetical protein